VRRAIKGACGCRPGKALKRARDDFKRNGGKGRMEYARIIALRLPLGSGVIECAIRRVVNLGLKGPSIYWHKTSAEAVLLLRAYSLTPRRGAGSSLRGRHLRCRWGATHEPTEMDRSLTT
jgi:hypothetical protein